ncbi:hypothetical protein ACKZDW_11375 [Ralstonia syzygii subsp. celebesensis]
MSHKSLALAVLASVACGLSAHAYADDDDDDDAARPLAPSMSC